MQLYGSCPSDARTLALQKCWRRFRWRLIIPGGFQVNWGRKERIAIARAYAGKPRVIVCDKPTSALDLSVQTAVLDLLLRLQLEERSPISSSRATS